MTVIEQETTSSWRPVQFLGNKLRVLDQVSDALTRGQQPGSTIWDAFSGSSVVSQSIASRGMRVIATDKLTCSVTFARAVLSVGRTPDTSVGVLRAVADIEPTKHYEAWMRYISKEDDAIRQGRAERLMFVSQELPLRWRPGGASKELLQAFDAAESAADGGVRDPRISMLSTYAGTYLGLRQSMELDMFATEILQQHMEARIDSWQRDVGLTALASAASAAVFSAGKHFAQPINATEQLTEFQARRLRHDRGVSIRQTFLRALDEIERVSPQGSDHQAFEAEAEHVTADFLRAAGVTTIYADPPYTAQQYSRFYHLLDTLVLGVPAKLQMVGGRMTKGLYPERRFKSAFCSRRSAPDAFRRLASQASDVSARLVLSYSVSAPASTGNTRSVSLDDLLGILRRAYGSRNVQIRNLDVRYRQFNQKSSAYAGREDPEILIVAGRDD